MVIPLHSFHPLMMTQSMDCFLTNTSSLPTHPYIPPATSCLPRDRLTSSPFCLSPASPHVPPKIWHPPLPHANPSCPLADAAHLPSLRAHTHEHDTPRPIPRTVVAASQTRMAQTNAFLDLSRTHGVPAALP